MRITRRQLRRMILKEMRVLNESPSKNMEDYLYGRGHSQIPDPEYARQSDIEQAMDAIERVLVDHAVYDALSGSGGGVDDSSYRKAVNTIWQRDWYSAPFMGKQTVADPSITYAEKLKRMKDAWMKKYNARLDREKRNYDDAMKPNLDDLNPSNYRHPDYDPYADGD